jgi:hypothetical protein
LQRQKWIMARECQQNGWRAQQARNWQTGSVQTPMSRANTAALTVYMIVPGQKVNGTRSTCWLIDAMVAASDQPR